MEKEIQDLRFRIKQMAQEFLTKCGAQEIIIGCECTVHNAVTRVSLNYFPE